MTIFANSRMTTLYHTSQEAWENHPCTVRMTGNEIVVEYDDDGLVLYKGEEITPGHYRLRSHDESGDAEATLHMSPDTLVLEGSWVVKEPGQTRKGMWKIFLVE